MSDITINIHNVVRGVVLDPPKWLRKMIHAHFKRFIVPSPKSGEPDFIIRSDQPDSAPEIISIVPGPQHRLGCVMHDGKRGVFLLRHNAPDVGIFPGDIPVVHCVGGEAAGRRTYGLILLAIDLALRQKGGTLFHGVCLLRDDRCVILYGARGSSKTLIGLSLMREGWDYVADDKFILSDGTAHLFEDVLGIRDHHVRKLPWLTEHLHGQDGVASATLHKMISEAGNRFVPKRYTTPWQRKWDERHDVKVTQAFPDIRAVEAASPDVCVHLRPSNRLHMQPLDDEDFHLAAAVQHMKFQEVHPLEDLLITFCNSTRPEPHQLLTNNLADTDMYQLETSDQVSAGQMAMEVDRCVE